MPTHLPSAALDAAALRAQVERATTGAHGAAGLGVEVELLPFATTPALRRLPISTGDGTLARLAAVPSVHASLGPDARLEEDGWWAGGADGARITFEPGGQLEISSCYRPRPAEALASADHATAVLAAALAPHARLVAVGIDRWTPGTVPQQRTAPRYPAMGHYLAERGPAGRTMMRDTAALQLNLDLSDGQEARARWSVTNLLAPVATATFATSPSADGRIRSLRSRAWQQLDPSRTGFVADDDPGASLADQLERFALEADVLLVIRPDGSVLPGRPGWRFGDWLANGDPRLGWPTAADLAVHLTTLFPEVRPRGYLEIRSIDAVPARWRHVPAVLYLGATYDPRARDRILEVLSRRAEGPLQQLQHAAVVGVSDPSWCALAVEVWSFALEGAARLPDGALGHDDLRNAERFLDRFTLRGRTPGDDLLDLWRAAGPAAALRWAAEPTSPSHPAVAPAATQRHAQEVPR
ncbi:MAG: glutamate-cysteine ligase family protein [Nitriliruptoraceae bacterium]